MRHPQLLIYEADGRLAALLRPVAEEHRWSLREPRKVETCHQLLERGGPGTLVLRIGRDLERELTLLERVLWRHPRTAAVVVGDAEHGELAPLAWDLGASCVLCPPSSRDALVEVVVALTSTAIVPEKHS